MCGSNSFYVTDSVCNCPEAQNQYMKDYAFLYSKTSAPLSRSNLYSATSETAWAHYKANSSVGGYAWKCELCTTNIVDPSTSLTCNCTSARAQYLSQYTSVTSDPWIHYTTTGKSLGTQLNNEYSANDVLTGNTWDCGICNDTCPGKYFDGAYTDASQPITSGQAITIPMGCYVGLPDSLSITTSDFTISGVFRCKNKYEPIIFSSRL